MINKYPSLQPKARTDNRTWHEKSASWRKEGYTAGFESRPYTEYFSPKKNKLPDWAEW